MTEADPRSAGSVSKTKGSDSYQTDLQILLSGSMRRSWPDAAKPAARRARGDRQLDRTVTPRSTTESMTTNPHRRETCPDCGGKVLPVLYGMPGEAAMKASEQRELIIGGCTLDDAEFRCACGATAYDFDDSSEDSFGIEDARDYIDEVRWQFAKTMPQRSHEYTGRDWRADLDDTFANFAELIRAAGAVKSWPANSPTPRYHHTYLEIDGWDYWTMGEPVAETEVINRARLDET